jgi:hypothetical protein
MIWRWMRVRVIDCAALPRLRRVLWVVSEIDARPGVHDGRPRLH